MIVDISARFQIPVFSAWRSRLSPSIREPGGDGRTAHRWKAILLIAASIACGRIAWSGEVLLLSVAAIFPMLWAMAPSRSIPALVAAGYFLAASRGLPQGVANFYAADLGPLRFQRGLRSDRHGVTERDPTLAFSRPHFDPGD
jgi:hypothetical protein